MGSQEGEVRAGSGVPSEERSRKLRGLLTFRVTMVGVDLTTFGMKAQLQPHTYSHTETLTRVLLARDSEVDPVLLCHGGTV